MQSSSINEEVVSSTSSISPAPAPSPPTSPFPVPVPSSSQHTISISSTPNQIPPDHPKSSGEDNEDENDDNHSDESEYEYDYEDEEECHLSGFLIQDPRMSESSTAAAAPATIPQDTPKIIEDDVKAPAVPPSPPPSSSERKSTWKEPTKEAVSMSLRAEREKTGGKRRLASDLYKVMMGDTEEQGFSMEPSSEDCMDKWKIKLFKFDPDSNLSKDLKSLGLDHVELEMSFPEQYPFEPPFVRVVKPRFKRQTGFVMNGALCMELLTSEGWNPVNDIESVIVSIRSLLVVGDGRLVAAAVSEKEDGEPALKKKKGEEDGKKGTTKREPGQYTISEARAAYSHLTDYHKKMGWDSSGWWARKG